MNGKKVRGLKRKTKNMINHIMENTMSFPVVFYDDAYWEIPLPTAQDFIESNATPFRVKKLCIQTLINRAIHLMSMKPEDDNKYRVVVAIFLPNLWDSRIIVFKDEEYFNDFFKRDNEEQKWIALSNARELDDKWGISVPDNMQTSSYKLVIMDEEYTNESNILFIGELSNTNFLFNG